MTSTQKTLAVGCLIGLFAAGVALVVARYQHGVEARYGNEPQPLSVQALAEQGLSGKHWVELIQGKLGPRAVVGAQRGAIDTIWIPVFPAGAAERTQIQVVLRSDESFSLDEFGLRLRDRSTFRGAVRASAAQGDLRTQLTAIYPDYPLAERIWEVDIDFGGPRYARWAGVVHSTSGGLIVFGVICLLGFIGSCFAAKEVVETPAFDSVPDLRY